jgi:hypothetical protein
MSELIKTSHSHPLRIDVLNLNTIPELRGRSSNLLGQLGLTFCPGKCHVGLFNDRWERNLAMDIDAVRAWGATAWINLMEDSDLVSVNLNTQSFAEAVINAGIDYYHLPIVDAGIPDAEFDTKWHSQISDELRQRLFQGQKLLVHCRGGLGRTGMVAARLLIDMGYDADNAVNLVRYIRHGAIETKAQESWAKGQS